MILVANFKSCIQIFATIIQLRLRKTVFCLERTWARLYVQNFERPFDDIPSTFYSLPLPPYFNYDVTGENAQICTLPTYSGDFQCSDRALVPPSKVGNVTCSLNATYYDASSPLDKLYIADGKSQSFSNLFGFCEYFSIMTEVLMA